MRTLCIGGGPAGLYTALLLKKARPGATRCAWSSATGPHDTFGWGVVFSDQTLGNLERADAATARAIGGAFNHWDDIEVHVAGPHRALRRPRVLRHRPAPAARHPAAPLHGRSAWSSRSKRTSPTTRRARARFDADVVVAADGINSRIRTRYADDVRARRRRCATAVSCGWARASASPRSRSRSRRRRTAGSRRTRTATTATRRRSSSRRPRRAWQARRASTAMSQEEGIAFCERLFARYLDGHAADVECGAPARLGDLDPLPARGLPPLGALARRRRPAHAGRADRRRRAQRALLGRLGHQARARGRDRARRCARRGGRRRARDGLASALAGYESAPRRGGAEDPERGAQLHRMVRARGALRRPAAASSSPTACSRAASASRTRTCACAIAAFVAGLERWFAERAGRGPTRRVPPMFTPFRCAASRCTTASSSRRWRSTRASTARPTTTTSCTSAAARTAARALVFTEMVCVARRRAHQPGLRRPVPRRASRRVDAHRRLRARAHAGEDRPAARPRGTEGFDAARLGGRRRAAARRATGR